MSRSRAIQILPVAIMAAISLSACGRRSAGVGPAKIRMIAAGGNQSCLLDADGVICWGDSYLKLNEGLPDKHDTPREVALAAGISIQSISVGSAHVCILAEEGEIHCWGDYRSGRLGAVENNIGNPGGKYSAVAAGGTHTCAIARGGGAKCWGSNTWGELGDGTTSESSSPVDVLGLGKGVKSIAAGVCFSCAAAGGKVLCWGLNDNFQLGHDTQTENNSPAPVEVEGLPADVAAVGAGISHACALAAGAVWCWGDNTMGELGNGTNVSSPAAVRAGSAGEKFSSIAVGGSHTCALTNRGGIKCWGDNSNGQLGDGTTVSRNQPADVLGLTEGVKAIAAGSAHTCALTEKGEILCWGGNEYGQLGNRSFTASSTPVIVVLTIS